jgi:hypothetical protein
MAEQDDTYEPSTVQVNRGREQGLGMGQKDLDYQRDPTGDLSVEQRSFAPDQDAQATDAAASGTDQAGPPGKPDEAYDDRDRDQLSFSWPAA